MRPLRSLALLSPLVTFALACGSLGDVDNRTPLAVIDGQLRQASTADAAPGAANVRVAVVWTSKDSEFKTAQDIPATPVFPSKFHLELTDPPPAGAMSSRSSKSKEPLPSTPPKSPGAKPAALHPSNAAGSDFAIATGTIVAYDDLNGNGKLDIVEEEASAYVDRILGVNPTLLIVYIEGSIPSDLTTDGKQPVLGYNLYKDRACPAAAANVRIGETPPAPQPCDAGGWLPISTEYDLPITADPRLAGVMCQGGLFGPVNTGSAQPVPNTGGTTLPIGPGPSGVWPKKDDPELHCYPDGKGYAYRTCTTISKGLCKGTNTECRTASWGYGTGTAPAEWPCPAK